MSQRTDSVQAGGETARMARDNLAKDDSMTWALVFRGDDIIKRALFTVCAPSSARQ